MPLRAWKALAAAVVMSLLAAGGAGATPTRPAAVRRNRSASPPDTVATLRTDMIDEMQATHPARHLGAAEDAPRPTSIWRCSGCHRRRCCGRSATTSRRWSTRRARPRPVDLRPGDVAGTGYFGIRPGAFLLIIDDDSISWCSLAHVWARPGSYDISTAGHCGRCGAARPSSPAFGNAAGTFNPVLLDFGSSSPRQRGVLGYDWAVINIDEPYQSLVTPTMPVWGGPAACTPRPAHSRTSIHQRRALSRGDREPTRCWPRPSSTTATAPASARAARRARAAPSTGAPRTSCSSARSHPETPARGRTR